MDEPGYLWLAVTYTFIGLVLVKVLMYLVYGDSSVANSDPISRTIAFLTAFGSQEKRMKGDYSVANVAASIDIYNDLHAKGVEDRNSSYTTLVNAYYDLATVFYEWGWGQSFHFAGRHRGESFGQAIRRHEYFLAARLNVRRGGRLLDVGCGIGGPMRNIAEFTCCHVTGVTLNQFQVDRGNEINASRGLTKSCKLIQGDFTKKLDKFEDESLDGAYGIEATCHAPDRRDVFGEIFRVLKPGSVFACYEWVLTDKYDPKNESHRTIKKQIEEGDGLPDMVGPEVVEAALEHVGFEILESRDAQYDIPPERLQSTWFEPLTPSYNLFSQRCQFTKVGRWVTTQALKALEMIGVAPKGTSSVQTMLSQAAIGIAAGGETGTFTPMWLCVARKPC